MNHADNITLTDSLERELLRKELDSYKRSAPLLDISSFIIAGLRRLQSESTSYVAAVSNDTDSARKNGHNVSAA